MDITEKPPEAMTLKPLLNRKQVCEYLGICNDTFTLLTQRDDTFPARKVLGSWRCDSEELETWFKAQRNTPDHHNVVAMPRRGRPPLSGTRPKTKVAR